MISSKVLLKSALILPVLGASVAMVSPGVSHAVSDVAQFSQDGSYTYEGKTYKAYDRQAELYGTLPKAVSDALVHGVGRNARSVRAGGSLPGQASITNYGDTFMPVNPNGAFGKLYTSKYPGKTPRAMASHFEFVGTNLGTLRAFCFQHKKPGPFTGMKYSMYESTHTSWGPKLLALGYYGFTGPGDMTWQLKDYTGKTLGQNANYRTVMTSLAFSQVSGNTTDENIAGNYGGTSHDVGPGLITLLNKVNARLPDGSISINGSNSNVKLTTSKSGSIQKSSEATIKIDQVPYNEVVNGKDTLKLKTHTVSFKMPNNDMTAVVTHAGVAKKYTKGQTVTLYGGDKFHFEAPLTSSASFTSPVMSYQYDVGRVFQGSPSSGTTLYQSQVGFKWDKKKSKTVQFNVKFSPQNSGIKITKQDEANGKALAGAQFGLYKTAADAKAKTNAIKTLTMDSNGTATASNLPTTQTTYYLREIKAPAGYQLAPRIYAAKITAGATTNVIIVDKSLPEIVRTGSTEDTVGILAFVSGILALITGFVFNKRKQI